MQCCATKIHFSIFLPILLTTVLFNHCKTPEPPSKKAAPKTVNPINRKPPPKAPPPPPSCEAQIAALEEIPNDTLDAFQKFLPYVVIDTKTTPVFFVRMPQISSDPKAAEIKRDLSKRSNLAAAISTLKKKYRNDKAMLRQIFLSEGYFFDNRPRIAHRMAKSLTLTDLFSAPTIFRWRNNQIEPLTKEGDKYVEENGEKALLLLNDRVSETEEVLLSPLHLDMGFIRTTIGAQRTLLEKRIKNGAVLTLVFPGGAQRIALVQLVENRTHVKCIGGDTHTLQPTLDQAASFWEQHRKICETAEQIVKERPIFDEPYDELEDVQEDGELRQAWRKAFRLKKKKFQYREVEYDVFDRHGNPIPPQVCVDFIVDTWERALGTWYTQKGEAPRRTEGRIDFYALENTSRRYISSLLDHALLPDSPFARFNIPQRDWAPLEKRRRYVRKLLKNAPHYQDGDLLVIHGLREEDMQEHYHTVLVLKTDPITGLPVRVADNQGRPRTSNLIQAMRAAPKRSVKYRLRVDFSKMAEITKQYRTAENE